MSRKLPQYDEEKYNELVAGRTGPWKFVARPTLDSAVCLISRIRNDGMNCRAILATNKSSNKSILTHAVNFHNFDVKKFLEDEAKKDSENMRRHLVEKKFNDIWNMKSALSRLVAHKGATLNFFKDNPVIDKLFYAAFKEKLPSYNSIRKVVISHSKEIKKIMIEKLRQNK